MGKFLFFSNNIFFHNVSKINLYFLFMDELITFYKNDGKLVNILIRCKRDFIYNVVKKKMDRSLRLL